MIHKEKVSIELSPVKMALKGKEVSFEQLDAAQSLVKDKKMPVNVRIVKLFDILKKKALCQLMVGPLQKVLSERRGDR